MHNIDPRYLDDEGNIRMCQICKSVKVMKTESWILDTVLYVSPPENVVNEICTRCNKKD
jgi:hypothetical protein